MGPSPTLEDAKRLYLKNRFTKTNPSEKSKKRDEQQADRMVGPVKSALGYDPVPADMKRAVFEEVSSVSGARSSSETPTGWSGCSSLGCRPHGRC